MKHTIELTTIELLHILKCVKYHNTITPIDKHTEEVIMEKISEVVRRDLKK